MLYTTLRAVSAMGTAKVKRRDFGMADEVIIESTSTRNSMAVL
jgi:hypothetical protein